MEGHCNVGRLLASLVAVIVVAPSEVSAQPRSLGGEILANTYTTHAQRTPAVAAEHFTVVWAEGCTAFAGSFDGSSTGIFGRSFSRDGSEQGPEGLVNVYTTSDALSALYSSVGAAACAQCICDDDASGQIEGADALWILKLATAQTLGTYCGPC